MVSKKISDCCYPITVKMGKEMRNGTLVLNVLHGKELEIEYSKKEIIDKINTFFGYNCIKNITLKVVQDKINAKGKIFSKIKNISKLDEKIKKVNHLISIHEEEIANPLLDYISSRENLKLIGGIMDNEVLDQAGVQNVASLPTLDEARANIIGILNAPASKLVSILLAHSEKMSNLSKEISETQPKE